jgi:hypothetical protein
MLTIIEEDDSLRQVCGFKKRDGASGNKSKGMDQAKACRKIADQLFMPEEYPFSTDDDELAKDEWAEQKQKWIELHKAEKDTLPGAVRSRLNTYVTL